MFTFVYQRHMNRDSLFSAHSFILYLLLHSEDIRKNVMEKSDEFWAEFFHNHVLKIINAGGGGVAQYFYCEKRVLYTPSKEIEQASPSTSWERGEVWLRPHYFFISEVMGFNTGRKIFILMHF